MDSEKIEMAAMDLTSELSGLIDHRKEFMGKVRKAVDVAEVYLAALKFEIEAEDGAIAADVAMLGDIQKRFPDRYAIGKKLVNDKK